MHSGRYVSLCTVNGEELNRLILREGWAVPYEPLSNPEYEALAREARVAKKGLHAFTFEDPVDARRKPKQCDSPDLN